MYLSRRSWWEVTLSIGHAWHCFKKPFFICLQTSNFVAVEINSASFPGYKQCMFFFLFFLILFADAWCYNQPFLAANLWKEKQFCHCIPASSQFCFRTFYPHDYCIINTCWYAKVPEFWNWNFQFSGRWRKKCILLHTSDIYLACLWVPTIYFNKDILCINEYW